MSVFDEEQLPQTLRGRTRAWMRRLSHAASVLARFGFSYVLHELELPLPRRQPVDKALARMELPERLRQALEELGPTAIKLGQVLSTRADLLPLPYIRELRKLQDAVAPASREEIEAVLQEELGRSVGELFAEFEETPRAAASIAQVHFARLRDGSPVAVKIQRQGVAAAIEIDLDIMLRMAQLAERTFPWAAENRLLQLVQEFAHSLRQELNFLIEARNTERLAKNLEAEEGAYVPRVYWGLCTRRVLVVEWVSGAKANDPAQLEAFGVDRLAAARGLAKLLARQILRDGFFHSDPHPGNVLFLGGDRVAFLDCGNVVPLDRATREALTGLLWALLSDEPVEVVDHLLTLGVASERTNVPQLTVDVGRLMSYYAGAANSAEIGLGELLEQVLTLVWRHGVRMSSSLAAIAKALMTAEGVCLQLDPTFDAQAVAREEAQRLLWEGLRPTRLGLDVLRAARGLYRYTRLLPRQLHQVLQRLQESGAAVRIYHENLERPLHRLDLMFNRLAFAIVVAAIIASSTLLVTSANVSGPLGHYLTYVYLFVGIVLGAWLVFSILRSGRL